MYHLPHIRLPHCRSTLLHYSQDCDILQFYLYIDSLHKLPPPHTAH